MHTDPINSRVNWTLAISLLSLLLWPVGSVSVVFRLCLATSSSRLPCVFFFSSFHLICFLFSLSLSFPIKMPETRGKRSDSVTETMIVDLKASIEEAKTDIISSLSGEISKLRDTVEVLTRRVEELESTNDTLKTKCKELSESVFDKVLEECEQRKRRENNIIISGLPEKNEGSLEDRKAHDKETVEKLLIRLEVWQDVDVVHMRRLGRPKPDDKSNRLLMVKFEDYDQKIKVAKRASALRQHEEYRRVYINFDLTPMQQKQRKEMMAELKGRRERGEDLVIFRNKIVPRAPKNFQ